VIELVEIKPPSRSLLVGGAARAATGLGPGWPGPLAGRGLDAIDQGRRPLPCLGRDQNTIGGRRGAGHHRHRAQEWRGRHQRTADGSAPGASLGHSHPWTAPAAVSCGPSCTR